MKLFLDSADISEISELAQTGLIDGITTNPSLVAKSTKASGASFAELLGNICELIDGDISAEVTALTADEMMSQAKTLLAIDPQKICIKLPLTWEGLKATRRLADAGHKTNVTLCFSANQALLAAKAGATYISPFIGRLDDIGVDGMELIADIRAIYDNYPALNTQILAASIRGPEHMRRAAIIGADVATIPGGVLRGLAEHPLTDKGLDAFLADWQASGQKIG